MPVSKMLLGDNVTYLSAIAQREANVQHYTDADLSIICSGEIYNARVSDLGAYLATAYQQWHKALPGHLYGSNWWFIIYDKNRKEVFTAVEQYGDTFLYYALHGNHLYISRNLSFFRSAIPASLDFQYLLANASIGVSVDRNNTHYKDIFYIPLGHTLSYNGDTLKLEKYWFPEAIAVREHQKKADLYEELYELYHDAVAKRLAGARKPAAMLSGGLDSGSVVTLAAQILATQNQSLHAASHIPGYQETTPDKHWFNDESTHINAILSGHKNISHRFLTSEKSCPIEGIENYLNVSEGVVAGAGNLYWILDIYKHLQETDADVCLSGKHGNYALSATGLPMQLPVYHPYYRHKPRRILSKLARPFKKIDLEKNLNESLAASYVSSDLLSREQKEQIIDLSAKALLPDSQKQNLILSLSLANNNHIKNLYGIYNRFGFQIKDPTADLRLIEFCLSLPNDMFYGPNGESRYLLRKIMHRSMPHSVLYEKQRGRQSSDISRRLIANKKKVKTTVETLLEDRDFSAMINAPKLQKTTQNILEDTDIGYYEGMNFLTAIMLGLFLRHHKK